jgi:hypothetical protein
MAAAQSHVRLYPCLMDLTSTDGLGISGAGDEVCGLRCVVPSPHRLVVAYSVVMAQCGGA